jgi:hypothetical protein
MQEQTSVTASHEGDFEVTSVDEPAPDPMVARHPVAALGTPPDEQSDVPERRQPPR